jgi:hypothetical protein
MKTAIKIIIGFLLTIGLVLLYMTRYTYPKAGEDYLLFLNPFQADQKYFDNNFEIAEQKLKQGDTIEAKKYYCKALEYRGTQNEKQRENIYSCANDYWEYKLDKILKYSKAFEICGTLDSAIFCLEPGLTSFEKWHYPIDKRFFELTVKKLGKQKTLSLLDKGLNKIGKLECDHCCESYFKFDNFNIGICQTDPEQSWSNKNELLIQLVDTYGI